MSTRRRGRFTSAHAISQLAWGSGTTRNGVPGGGSLARGPFKRSSSGGTTVLLGDVPSTGDGHLDYGQMDAVATLGAVGSARGLHLVAYGSHADTMGNTNATCEGVLSVVASD